MKKKIIFLSIFILVLLLGGVGIYYYTQSHRDSVTFAEGEAKYKTYTEKAPIDGSLPTDHDSYKNIAYVLWNIEHTNNFSSTTMGTAVSVGQKQTIYNHRIVNGDKQLVDTVSGGLVTLGKQKFFKDGKVLLRDFVSQDGDDITWKTEDPECITYAGYIKRYGWLPTQSTAYIICKETILDISDVEVLENGNFQIHLNLNPNWDYAPFWYRREVAENASSLEEPIFSSIEIDYIFDAKWQCLEVKTKEKYTVKPKVAPLKVECTTDITETFDYAQFEMDEDALNYFKNYEDMKPSDGEVVLPTEDTPLSYITGSLMGGDTEKNFRLSIDYQEKQLDGIISININDLNHIIVKLKIDDLLLIYEGDTIYLSYGTTQIKGNVKELENMLTPLLRQIVLGDGNKPASTNLDFDLNAIMNDLNAGIVEKNGDQVMVHVTLNILGIKLPILFDISVQGMTYQLNSIESNIMIGDQQAAISLTKDDSVEFEEIDKDSYQDLKNLNFIIDDLTSILEAKKVEVGFEATISDVVLSGVAVIDFSNGLSASVTVDINYQDIVEKITLHFVNETIFLEFRNQKLKVTKEALTRILSLELKLPLKPKLDIVNQLSKIDFKSIIKHFSLTENELLLQLDIPDYGEINGAIYDTEAGFNIQVNVFDLTLFINAHTEKTIEVDDNQYVDLMNYVDYLDYLLDLIGKKSFGLRLNGQIEGIASFNGYVDFILVDGAYQIASTIQINYQNQMLDLKLWLKDDAVFVSCYNQTFCFKKDTFIKSFTEILQKFGISISMPELPSFDYTTIVVLLSSIELKEDCIIFDCSSLDATLGKVIVEFSQSDNLEAHIQFDKLEIFAQIQEIEDYEMTVPEQYMTEDQILQLLDYVTDVLKMVQNKHGYFSFQLKVGDTPISGEVYMEWINGFKARIDVSVLGIEFTIFYVDDTLYVNYKDQIKIQVSKDKISDLITLFLPDNSFEDPSSIQLLDVIEDFFKNMTFEENKISTMLQVIGIPKFMIDFIQTDLGFDIQLNLYDFYLSFESEKTLDLTLQADEYSNTDLYFDFFNYLMSIEQVGGARISIDASYVFTEGGQAHTLTVCGMADINYNAETKKLDMTAMLDIMLDSMQLDISIYLIDQQLYIGFLNQVVSLSIEELSQWIESKSFKTVDMGISPSMLLTIMDTLLIEEGKISLNLESLSSIFKNGSIEFDLDELAGATIYFKALPIDLSLSFLLQEPKNIVVPQPTISAQELFYLIDGVLYLKNAIYKDSIHLEIPDAIIDLADEQIKLNGAVDFVLNKNKKYDIEGNLAVTIKQHTEELHFIFKEDILYVTLLDQTIMLSRTEILALMNRISDLIGLEKKDNLLPDLNVGLLEFILDEQFIEFDFSKLLDVLLVVRIAYEYHLEGDLNFMGKIDLSFEKITLSMPIVLSKSNLTEVSIPTGVMLTYADVLEWLEQISYMLQLYNKGAIHLAIGKTNVSLKQADKDVTLTVEGSFDILLHQGFSMTGYLDIEGAGIVGRIGLTLIGTDLYLSVLGQTIHLNLNTIESFINQVMDRLQSIKTINLDFEKNILFNDFELSLSKNNIEFILNDLVSTMIRISCFIDVITTENQNFLNLMIDASVDSFVSIEHLVINIFESELEAIVAPAGTYLEQQDLLILLEDFISIYQLKDMTSAGFDFGLDIIKNGLKAATLTGYLEFKLISTNEFDAKLDLYVREYDAKGNSKGWHQVHLSILSASTMNAWNQTSEAMIFGTYGNLESDPNALLKIKSTYTGIENLIQSILKLVHLDELISFENTKESFNVNELIHQLSVDNNQVIIKLNTNKLFPAMTEAAIMELIFEKDSSGICGIRANNLCVSYQTQFNTMVLDSLFITLEKNKEVVVLVPADVDSYMDVSNSANLFEALYNNALERDFEIRGKLELQALSIIKKEIGVLIQIHVEENGEPTLYAQLDIPSVPFMLSKKLLHIYYSNQYVYIYREDSTAKDSRQVKLHYSVFMDNIVYYLLDFGMGMPDMILNQINNSSNKGKGYVNAANCVTSLMLGENSFQFGLNLGEIADNSDLGNLNITIESSMVTKLDENGEEVLVPMIHKITDFSFDMVSVIKLTLAKGSMLTLSNIVNQDDKLIVQEMDFTEIYNFVNQYSFDEDKEYSYDGTNWVEGKAISHTASFINEFANETISKEYYKDELIEFPNYDIITVGDEFYQMVGWYYDNAFSLPVTDPYIMGNRNAVFYAKMNNITSHYMITDDFGSLEETIKTYQNQSLEELYKKYQNTILSIEDHTFKFTHFELYENGKWVPFDEVIASLGTYKLKACYEEIYYTALLVETNETIRLSASSDRVLQSEAYLLIDNLYFGFRNDSLTDRVLLNHYLDYFDENNQIRIYASTSFSSSYSILSWDCSNVDLAYNNRIYNAIAYTSGTAIENLLPNGSTDYYEINEWVDENGNYYTPSDFTFNTQSLYLKPYVANKAALFTFDQTILTGYTGGNQVKNIIVPRHYINDSKQVIFINAIGENAFKDQNDFTAIVLAEGIEAIYQHAFQNAKGLREVYMPTTLKRIDSEAFLYDYGTSFETRRDENAIKLRLYYLSQQQNNQFGRLTACYANYLFGKKYAYYGEKTTGSWAADLSQTFQYANKGASILDISSSLLAEIL